MAVISKGITLKYGQGGPDSTLTNLMEIPEMGGDRESIEVTVLSDSGHTYTNGIYNYGDNLAFKFLYEKTQFDELNTMAAEGTAYTWIIYLPDGSNCSFDGACSVKLDGVGVNAALTYTLNIKPSSAMEWGKFDTV